jgi:endoglycosylceramidase
MRQVRVQLVRLLAAAVVLGGLTVFPASATASPVLPLSHSGRWITDAAGRVVIVHGTNMVYKLAPFYPAAVGFGADDAAFLRSIGFNAVRVGVIWAAVEPQPGVYDDAYIAQIKRTVDTLGRFGIVSLLDFHQDLLNEQFQGEGAPSWAIQTGGLPNPSLGFPGNYLGNPALEHALDAFWQNAPGPGGVGLWDRFAGAWRQVASAFRADSNVLGYEVFNEPFPGTLWEQCLVPTGCPSFDAELTGFYARVIHAIRGVDHRTLIFYEPNVLFNEGIATDLGQIGDPRAGFAFHDYCPTESTVGSDIGCGPFDDTVFSHAVTRATSTGDAVLETEFGATNNVPYLEQMVARGDSDMVPWLEWAYCGCGDPTTSGPGNVQAIVIDPAKPPTGANLLLPTLRALVEPYPQAIAGTPVSWGFDRSTDTFSLEYKTARAAGSGSFAPFAESDVVVPALVYPHGYAASASGGAIVSVRDAHVLEVAACPGASTVKVTVTPGGTSHGSCRPWTLRWRRRRRGR